MRKRWLAASYDKDLAAQIAEEHSLNPIAALLAVLYSRPVRPARHG